MAHPKEVSIFLALALLCTGVAQASDITIRGVARVVDGDTLKIGTHNIRLHGIDAPETRQNCRLLGQEVACGKQVKQELADRLGQQPVLCKQRSTDRYRRIVAVCWVGGEDINGWLVRQGLALAYQAYAKDYVSDQILAEQAGVGLWQMQFEMPWDWRAARRKPKS